MNGPLHLSVGVRVGGAGPRSRACRAEGLEGRNEDVVAPALDGVLRAEVAPEDTEAPVGHMQGHLLLKPGGAEERYDVASQLLGEVTAVTIPS